MATISCISKPIFFLPLCFFHILLLLLVVSHSYLLSSPFHLKILKVYKEFDTKRCPDSAFFCKRWFYQNSNHKSTKSHTNACNVLDWRAKQVVIA